MRKFNNIYLLCQGRVSRKTYWLCGIVPAILVSLVCLRLGPPLWLALTVLTVAGYIGLMLSIKRSHDLGRSGFFTLLLVVPVLNLWPLILFAFYNGAAEENQYGPPDRRFPNVLVNE